MEKMKQYWEGLLTSESRDDHWWRRKRELCSRRNVEIVRIKGTGRSYRSFRYDEKLYYEYLLHMIFFMKQNDYFYLEEQAIPYQFRIENDEIIDHKQMNQYVEAGGDKSLSFSDRHDEHEQVRFSYDRRAAVQYAERWWNSYNPAYQTFAVDCTNYVSQCLRAGGAPMWGAPNRSKGWWYGGENWSYSWAVSHSLRWYLSGSTTGLQGKEVDSADQLMPGDVICYDFQGDGRWDHSTIVVAKDGEDMPLVNAHTDNSRHRYWSYEDSTAWTPDIQYKFFQIG